MIFGDGECLVFCNDGLFVADVYKIPNPLHGHVRTFDVCHVCHVVEHQHFGVLWDGGLHGGHFEGNAVVLFAVDEHNGAVGSREKGYGGTPPNHALLRCDDAVFANL